MAHQVSFSPLGFPSKSRRVHVGAACRTMFAYCLMPLLVAALMLAPGSSSAQTASTYVPAVVVSSVSPVPVPTPNASQTGFAAGNQTPVLQPIDVAVDSCNNVYVVDKGEDALTGPPGDLITEIPANGGPATIVANVGAYYPGHLGQDPLRQNLIVGLAYDTGGELIPIGTCVPQYASALHVGAGDGNSNALFYYYNAGYFAGDFLGDTIVSSQGTCCVTGNFYLIQVAGGYPNIILSNTAKEIQSMAVDVNQNIYFIEGGAVFELPYSGGAGGKYALAPVAFGTAYSDPIGLSVDTLGNMYVADQGATTIYEIPNEATGTGSALNLADQFKIAGNISIAVPVAANSRGDLYYTPPNASAVEKLSLGNANFGSVAIGQTVNKTLNFQFNASVTPAAVQLPTGVFGTKSGGNGFAQCTAGTAYGTTGNTYCQVIVTFTPTTVGKQSSAVILADAQGNSISTAYIEGVGEGPTLTLDPGSVAPTGSGLASPTGVAVDAVGNTYIADSTSNAIIEFPAGSGTPVTLNVSAASLPLAAPTGVAVDGLGNVFVADTGNNRVVEVPFINGALSVASAAVVASGFNAPAGVFVNTNGDLYVTDTGNNAVDLFASFGGKYGLPTSLGTGLNAPLATTVDSAGDVYIANSGNNTILELPVGGGQELVDAGILNPSAMATDSSGALFVVDQGNFRVLRIPSVAGTLSTNNAAEVGFGVANPYGVALDASSNLYVTDMKAAAAYVFNRSMVGLSFGELAVAGTSDALPLTVESAGNLPLVFNTPYYTSAGATADFAVASPSGACTDGVTLAPGSSCDLSATFTPAAAGAASETLTFSSNSLAPASAVLTGTGMGLATSTTALAFTFAAGPNAPFYGEPLSFTATVTGTTPTGSVAFVVDGVQVALLPLVSGVATLPLNSGLTGGSHSVYAVYKGDSANDGSSSAPLAITISKAPTTATIVVSKIPYNNPYNLRHSNIGSCNVTDASGNINTFPAIPNDGASFVASVSSPGVGIPSGTLTFYSDGVLINMNSTDTIPPPSIAALLPAAGGLFSGSVDTDANSLGDGTTLGENNVLLGPHVITAIYSGDQNYLPSTSTGVTVTVLDVSPTTPVILPESPVQPAPYCDASTPIQGSRPEDPSSFQVQTSSTTATSTSTVPGTLVLTISSLAGYNGFADVSCSNLPQYTTCSTNPGQVTILPSSPGSPTTPTTVTVTFTTNVPPYIPTASQGLIWLPALVLGIVVLLTRRRFQRINGALTFFGIAMLLIGGVVGLGGCGGGTSSSASAVTKPGSYQVNIVLLGSQNDPEAQYSNEVFRPDVPYSIPVTLVVK